MKKLKIEIYADGAEIKEITKLVYSFYKITLTNYLVYHVLWFYSAFFYNKTQKEYNYYTLTQDYIRNPQEEWSKI